MLADLIFPSAFEDLLYRWPQGCCWSGDSMALVRQVTARLQTLLRQLRETSGIILALDEPDSEDSPPSGIILVAHGKTHVIPVQCRKLLIRVDAEPVFVGDSAAVMRLARQIADVVDFYVMQMQAPKTPRRKQRA